jgi:hypothetical protein
MHAGVLTIINVDFVSIHINTGLLRDQRHLKYPYMGRQGHGHTFLCGGLTGLFRDEEPS